MLNTKNTFSELIIKAKAQNYFEQSISPILSSSFHFNFRVNGKPHPDFRTLMGARPVSQSLGENEADMLGYTMFVAVIAHRPQELWCSWTPRCRTVSQQTTFWRP